MVTGYPETPSRWLDRPPAHHYTEGAWDPSQHDSAGRDRLSRIVSADAGGGAAPRGAQQVREHGAVALGVSQHDEVADGSISTGNGLVAAFSGRLDNAADLRQQLAAHGRAAAGETPADIVEAGVPGVG